MKKFSFEVSPVSLVWFNEIMIVTALTIQGLAQSTYQPYTFTTLAGGGGFNSPDVPGTAARFFVEKGVTVDSAGNIYVADKFNHAIRRVAPAGRNWNVTTLAGQPGSPGSTDGTGSEARFSYPERVAVDRAGNVYVAENYTIRKVTPEGTVTTLAGKAGISDGVDGTNGAARFYDPEGMAVDSAGNIYVADAAGGTIRKVTPFETNWVVTTLAGRAGVGPISADGTNTAARFNYPTDVALDSAGNLYVADTDSHNIRKITPLGTNWVVTTIAGTAGSFGSVDGTNSTARFNFPSGLAVDAATSIYVADSGNSTIRKVTPAGTNWVVTTLGGLAGNAGSVDGIGIAARFAGPSGVALDGSGSAYLADSGGYTIRKMTPDGTNWVVTTVAGLGGIFGNADGTGGDATFRGPSSVAVDKEGSVYVADQVNDAIRKVTSAGEVTTLAGLAGYAGSTDGSGTLARFAGPAGVAVDAAGNLYVADFGNGTIRKVTSAGVVTTLAGLAGNEGSADGTGSAASFQGPSGVALDSATNLYVADSFNNTIRKVSPAGVVTTRAGSCGETGSTDGVGAAARFNHPTGLAVDSATNVYVADTWNHTIRKITGAGMALPPPPPEMPGDPLTFDMAVTFDLHAASN